MDELKEVTVPYVVHEGEMTRMERTNHRLWVLCILLLLSLLITNIGWVWYESQFEYYEEVTQDVTQDSGDGGYNNFVGGDYYGETTGEDNN